MTAESTKRPSQTSAINRKISKGVIERKRRARINRSLSELKFIILSDSKDKGLHSKLDKAEILERTLNYVQSMQTREINSTTTDSMPQLNKYRDGFFACMDEIDRFLAAENVDAIAKHKITNYLTFCSNSLDQLLTQQVPAAQHILPEALYEKSTTPFQFATVPGSPSPSFSSTASDYSSSSISRQSTKSDSVWRPW